MNLVPGIELQPSSREPIAINTEISWLTSVYSRTNTVVSRSKSVELRTRILKSVPTVVKN